MSKFSHHRRFTSYENGFKLIMVAALLLLFAPKLSLCECFLGPEKFTEECKQYCSSKRPAGEYGEFHADCELVVGIISTNLCLGSCANNNCPCQSCPTGEYVICPAIPSPPTTPPPPPLVVDQDKDDQDEDDQDDSIDSSSSVIKGSPVWLWIIVASSCTYLY